MYTKLTFTTFNETLKHLYNYGYYYYIYYYTILTSSKCVDLF